MKCSTFIFFFLTCLLCAEEFNLARPDRHRYADPSLHREGKRFSDHPVNEARLYDFYQRQADEVMRQEARPMLLPAHPGLDAGLYGHWGKHHQNSHQEPRINDMDFGRLHFQMTGDKDLAKGRHVAFLSLGEKQELHTVYDPVALTFSRVWSGDFITVDPFRWGASRGAKPAGKSQWSDVKHSGWVDEYGDPVSGELLGWARSGRHTVFESRIGENNITDHADAVGALFIRTVVNRGTVDLYLALMRLPDAASFIAHTSRVKSSLLYGDRSKRWWVGSQQATSVTLQDGLLVATIPAGSEIQLALWHGAGMPPQADIQRFAIRNRPAITDLLKGGTPQWPEVLSGPQQLAEESGPIAIDTLYAPTNNSAKAMMLLSGIDFTSEGDAIVCTLPGEVWRVSGLSTPDGLIHWRKIAGGINQPFGLRVDGRKIYIMARTQILALHDRNFDQEIDYYEVVANDFNQRSRGIAMHFGLEKNAQGELLFIAGSDLCRWSPTTRKTEIVAEGFRNGMGLGIMPDGRALVAPQEGHWTPASMIVEALPGEHYGFGGFSNKSASGQRIDLPLCYIPRGIDNSTGGLTYIDRGTWGPMQDSIYGYSYGAGSHYYVLIDDSGPRPQGAVVPLPGHFSSGVVRAQFNPNDDHIYVVGTEGWGNYAVADGSFNRVRYTGKSMQRPIGYQGYANGLRVSFEDVLDPFEAEKPDNYLVQQWSYEYADRYGSPEFSLLQPNELGHDVLTVLSVKVLEDGRSVFIEIPELTPACQVYVRMHMRTAEGETYACDLFPTIKTLGPPFEHEGLAPLVENKPALLNVRVRRSAPKIDKRAAKQKSDRAIILKAITGLRYDKTEITARAGERLAISLVNEDVGMQHNWVLVQPDASTAVGEASFKMLSDPAAAEKNYVPDLPSVIADIPLVDPGKTITQVIKVPKKPGRYPFLCTFPGHWQAMKGVLIVTP